MVHTIPNAGAVGRMRTIALLTGAWCLLAAHALSAQGWQETIGWNNIRGEEGTAAIETDNGEIVTVGFTFTISGTSDMYFVRTDRYGAILTHTAYPMTGYVYGVAMDVKEFADGTGDLAVVGHATNNSGNSDIIVMRLFPFGAVKWVRALHIDNVNLTASGVVIAKFGSGGAAPQDVVVSGRSVSGAGSDGVLARLSANGAFVWYKDYNISVAGGFSGQRLHDVDEARVTTATTNAGDIVAVGTADVVFAADVPSDVWVLRVDGNTGSSLGTGHGSVRYGTTETDEGLAICELRNGAHNGDLAIAGRTYGRPGSGPEVLVMQTLPDPTTGLRASSFLGDNAGASDWGNGICEVIPALGANTGNIVVAGVTYAGPFGDTDGRLEEFQGGTLAAGGVTHCRGAAGEDLARARAPVQHGVTSQGYVLTGYTTSTALMPAGNIRNLYLLRNYTTLANNCYSTTVTLSDAAAVLARTASPVVETGGSTLLTPTDVPVSPVWDALPLCEPDAKIVVPHGSIGAATPGSGAMMPATARPTPVRAGREVVLTSTMAEAGTVRLVVTDLTGRRVYATSFERPRGTYETSVPTTGLSAGAYTVTMTSNGSTAVARIIVADR